MQINNVNINNNANLDVIKSKVQNNDNTTDADKKKLMDTCKQLESEFVKIMFKEMKKTIHETDEAEKKSSGREIFDDLYTEELANSSSKNSSLGLAKMIYDQYTRNTVSKIKENTNVNEEDASVEKSEGNKIDTTK